MARAWIYAILAVTMIVPGAIIVVRSIGASPAPDGTPVWIGTVMGLVFLAGGSSVILQAITGGLNQAQGGLPENAPAFLRIVYNGFALVIVVGLGTLFTWVAFGPGERHFIARVSFGPAASQFSGSGAFSGSFVGRAMFGLAAVLVWIALAWFGARWLKQRRPGDTEQDVSRSFRR